MLSEYLQNSAHYNDSASARADELLDEIAMRIDDDEHTGDTTPTLADVIEATDTLTAEMLGELCGDVASASAAPWIVEAANQVLSHDEVEEFCRGVVEAQAYDRGWREEPTAPPLIDTGSLKRAVCAAIDHVVDEMLDREGDDEDTEE